MAEKMQRSISLTNVRVQDPFWSHVQTLITDTVIPYQEQIMNDAIPGVEKSHAMENFRIAAGDVEGEFYGMVFQDSDVAKWLEAVAYSLSFKPDADLERRADEVIDLIGRAQQEDGYLNTYFIVKEPEHRWQNLMECHELYCAGHLIEAAVAYYEVTGKDKFLSIMCRYTDLICDRFGKGKVRGVPGHQEIELALIRLYRVTGRKEYLDTAKYFLDERGTAPDFFAEEAKKRDWAHFHMNVEDKKYAQTFAPVREQSTAEGHSVRAAYMYTAMADLAAEIGDEELKAACLRLWDNIVEKRMYVTGGVGSTHYGEAFTIDYDLPNDTIYAETCASVAMVFFARRMLEMDVNGRYGDVIEKMLYNGVLSGQQLDGKRFFYVNPLEVVPGVSGVLQGFRHVVPERPGWYTCACCPPNVARLMADLGEYAWGENEDTVFAHFYLGSSADFRNGAHIDCVSSYPWQGKVKYTVTKAGKSFTLALHQPGWVKDMKWTLNGEALTPEVRDGYAFFDRLWQDGDTVEAEFAMPVRRVYANSHVRADAGCVALLRGPIVYCLEEKDNGSDLSALRLPRAAKIEATECEHELGHIVTLTAQGLRDVTSDSLYSEEAPTQNPATLTAIPYYAWGNRGAGGMRVWIREQI